MNEEKRKQKDNADFLYFLYSRIKKMENLSLNILNLAWIVKRALSAECKYYDRVKPNPVYFELINAFQIVC